MEKKDSTMRIGLAVLILLVTGYLAYLYWVNRSQYDWQEDSPKNAFKHISKEPVGSSALYEILGGYFPQNKLIQLDKKVSESLPKDAEGTYFFLGMAAKLDSADASNLLDFARRGGTVFISSKVAPESLLEIFYGIDSLEYATFTGYDYLSSSDSVGLTFLAQREDSREITNIPFFLPYKNEPTPGTFSIFDEHPFRFDEYFSEPANDQTKWEVLGTIKLFDEETKTLSEWEEQPVVPAFFVGHSYGQGRIFLHTVPLAFTNYHLLRSEGREHCTQVLGYLPKGDIYWDTYSQVNKLAPSKKPKMASENPLATLLKEPSLATALAMTAILGILFVAFQGKRRQRIIPILPKNHNTSLEFVDAIAFLHFSEKNYRGIGIQKMQHFLAFLRENYTTNIRLNADGSLDKIDTNAIERISQRAEVPKEALEKVFLEYSILWSNSHPEWSYLESFQQALEHFRLSAKR